MNTSEVTLILKRVVGRVHDRAHGNLCCDRRTGFRHADFGRSLLLDVHILITEIQDYRFMDGWMSVAPTSVIDAPLTSDQIRIQ